MNHLKEPEKLAWCGCFPTPLHRLDRLSEELKCNILIKRDDLTGVGFSGNKIRKLQYLMQDAINQGCTTVVTFGGVQTNHGRQTAAVARRCGLHCIIIATMKDDAPPTALSGNLLLDEILGCEMIFMDTASIRRDSANQSPDEVDAKIAKLRRKVADQVISECAARGEKVYEIPAGGSTPIGCMGYFYAVKEIQDQLTQMGQTLDYVICPSGSKGTFAGLWLGAKYYNASFEVLGSCISPHSDAYVQKITSFINEVSDYFEMGICADQKDIRMICSEYAGTAYDKPDPMTFETIYRFAQLEGMFVDPCYSAKGLTALIKMIEKGEIPQGSNVLFLHTGGLPALYSTQHLEQFNRDLWDQKAHRVISIDLED